MPPTSRLAAVLAALVVAPAVSVAGCSSDGSSGAPASPSAACTDVARISKQLNSISDDLAGSKKLFAGLQTSSASLVQHAPADLHAKALKLQRAVAQAKTFIDSATTIEQLHTLEQTSAKLQQALNGLAQYGVDVANWRHAHCVKR